MTWIESFPSPQGPNDKNPSYLFFIDIDGHAEDEAVKQRSTSPASTASAGRPRLLPQGRDRRVVTGAT